MKITKERYAELRNSDDVFVLDQFCQMMVGKVYLIADAVQNQGPGTFFLVGGYTHIHKIIEDESQQVPIEREEFYRFETIGEIQALISEVMVRETNAEFPP